MDQNTVFSSEIEQKMRLSCNKSVLSCSLIIKGHHKIIGFFLSGLKWLFATSSREILRAL